MFLRRNWHSLEENNVPRTLFEVIKVAGSATCKQSETVWNCVVLYYCHFVHAVYFGINKTIFWLKRIPQNYTVLSLKPVWKTILTVSLQGSNPFFSHLSHVCQQSWYLKRPTASRHPAARLIAFRWSSNPLSAPPRPPLPHHHLQKDHVLSEREKGLWERTLPPLCSVWLCLVALSWVCLSSRAGRPPLESDAHAANTGENFRTWQTELSVQKSCFLLCFRSTRVKKKKKEKRKKEEEPVTVATSGIAEDVGDSYGGATLRGTELCLRTDRRV